MKKKGAPMYFPSENVNSHMWIQFLELMIKRGDGPFLKKSGYVQSGFVSAEDKPLADTIQLVQRFFPKHDTPHVFPYNGYVVLIFENKAEATAKRLLENLHDYLRKLHVPADITVGTAAMEDNSCPGSGIRKTCREAEELMKSTFFHRGKKYLSIDDVQTNRVVPQLNISDEAKTLVSYIHTLNSQKVNSFFARLEAYFLCSGKSSLEVRQECMVLMIEARTHVVRKIPALKEELGTGKKIFDTIMGHRYLATIIEAMAEVCLRISECLSFLSTDARLQRVVSYVENNYSEKLNLKGVAELFYYNCAYLGKSFKKHTGKSFSEYLDMLRIDAAKKMLVDTGMKVYEISAAIGYTNTDYFHSKFRKYAMESPLAFRKKGDSLAPTEN